MQQGQADAMKTVPSWLEHQGSFLMLNLVSMEEWRPRCWGLGSCCTTYGNLVRGIASSLSEVAHIWHWLTPDTNDFQRPTLPSEQWQFPAFSPLISVVVCAARKPRKVTTHVSWKVLDLLCDLTKMGVAVVDAVRASSSRSRGGSAKTQRERSGKHWWSIRSHQKRNERCWSWCSRKNTHYRAISGRVHCCHDSRLNTCFQRNLTELNDVLCNWRMSLVRVVLLLVNTISFILASDDSAAIRPQCVKVIGTFLREQSGDVCCWAVALNPRHRVCDARCYHGVPWEHREP